MSDQLVLSLFPGIGLLDRAFEEEGFIVVRGPDPLWGGDIRRFRPPAGKFDGVIGGPPCQIFSPLKRLNPIAGERFGNLIPEFERCVTAANPRWFLMENVPEAPIPIIAGYEVHAFLFNNRWLGEEQNRLRRFCFGTPQGLKIWPETVALESQDYAPTVTRSMRELLSRKKRTKRPDGSQSGPASGPRIDLADMLRLQGIPGDFFEFSPFTMDAKRKMIGNGVPLPMGRALAKAIKQVIHP